MLITLVSKSDINDQKTKPSSSLRRNNLSELSNKNKPFIISVICFPNLSFNIIAYHALIRTNNNF